MRQKILFIDEDTNLIQGLSPHLEDLGFEVTQCSNPAQAVASALAQEYSLIILELAVPGANGFEICREIRSKKKTVPLVVLSTRSEEIDKVIAFDLGADDYITKPFSLLELIARIRAVIRSTLAIRAEVPLSKPSLSSIQFDNLAIDLQMRKVTRSKATVKLTKREYDLLSCLASSPGKPFTRQQLRHYVWGFDYDGYDYTVDTLVWRLRKKLETNPSKPKFIGTVRSIGYCFLT